MGWQIIKQPDNLYCIFSSVVDGILEFDRTREQIIESYRIKSGQEGAKHAEKVMTMVDNGEKPYFQFTMSFDEMLEWINQVHGTKIKWKSKTG